MNRVWHKLGIVTFWLVWPLTWIVLRRSSRTRLLLRVGDEILVSRTWLSSGRWSLSGGGLHRGEAPLAGVIREVREEIGVNLRPEMITPLQTQRYHGDGQSFLCYYFTVTLPAKPDIKLQRFEISAARWIKPSEISSKHFGPDVHAALGML